MKFNINKELISKGLNAGVKLGKSVLWEGVKVVLVKGAANTLTTSLEKGLGGVKSMSLDDFLGKNKRNPFSEIMVSKPKEEKVVVDGEFEVVQETKSEVH